MRYKATSIRLIASVFCCLFCCIAISKPVQNSDSLHVSEFNSLAGDEAKLKWLLENNLPDVNDFIKRYPDAYDSFSQRILAGNNERLKYQLRMMEGFMHYQQGHYQKAIPVFLDILNQKQFITQKDSVRIIINLKVCFAKVLNYPKVFEMHQLLMRIIKRNPEIKNNDLGLPLSQAYINMGLISEGINYLRKEYYAMDKSKSKFAEANFYNNLGVVWKKGGKPDSAIYYYRKAQHLVKNALKAEPKSKYLIFFDGLIAGNIGQALIDKKKIKEAIPLLKKDIYNSLITGNLQNAAISYNELAHCYFLSRQYNLSQNYLDSSLSILKDIDDPIDYLKNLKLRAMLLSSMQRYEEAAHVYQNFISLNDSLAATEKELLMLNQQIAHQTNELQEKIEIQEEVMASNKLLEEKRNTQRTLLFVLLFMLLVILFLGSYSYFKSKKREKILAEKNEVITVKSGMLEVALIEQELLIKEVHHRVKNNMQIIMSLLKLQAEKINDKQVEVYFSEARSRILSMALIHEFLYKKEKMDYLQMDNYLIQLTTEIQNSHQQPNHKIEIKTDCDQILLDFDTSVPLGLIVNELVTNAYKHAFSNGVGSIWLSFKNAGNNYILVVKDNGVGVPENFENKKENSLGMELIQLLSAQINGKVKINHEGGFEVIITFPKATSVSE